MQKDVIDRADDLVRPVTFAGRIVVISCRVFRVSCACHSLKILMHRVLQWPVLEIVFVDDALAVDFCSPLDRY